MKCMPGVEHSGQSDQAHMVARAKWLRKKNGESGGSSGKKKKKKGKKGKRNR